MSTCDGDFRSSVNVFPAVSFSTSSLEEPVKNDAWRRLTAPLFEATVADARQHAVLEGGMTAHFLGGSVVGTMWFNAQHLERDQRLVLSTGLDQYIVQLFLEGGASVVCGGREVDVRVGDILVLDLAKTASTFAPKGGNTVWMMVSHDKLDRESAGRNLHGAVIRSYDPLASLLREMLMSLCQHGHFARTDDESSIEGAAVSLLVGVIIRSRLDPIQSAPVLSMVLRRRIFAYVEEHLTNPQLGVEHFVVHFKVSRAHLYRIFSEEGGVASMIRDRRLDAAYRDLTRGGEHPAGSITETAHKYFFSSSNHFLRAFRARFCCSPSEAIHVGMGVRVKCSASGILEHLTGVVASMDLPS